MLTEQQLTHFREQGYVLVPDALQDFDRERVLDAFEKARRQTEPAEVTASGSTKGVYDLGPAAHVMVDIWQFDDLFLDLADNPAVFNILRQVVGHDLQLTETIGHIHPAGTPPPTSSGTGIGRHGAIPCRY